ncbi:hypothetical protein [Carp edema virus]|nr:hypothetical protein [Carp edema virus]
MGNVLSWFYGSSESSVVDVDENHDIQQDDLEAELEEYDPNLAPEIISNVSNRKKSPKFDGEKTLLTKIQKSLKDIYNFECDDTHEIVDVKAVFHTWVAIHGTEILTPEIMVGERNFDYVGKIKENAAFLNSKGIPLFVVYSILNLSDEQIKKMNDNFKDEENVMLLSLEHDLSTIITPDTYLNEPWYKPKLDFMDRLRVMVICNAPGILECLRQKANAFDKTVLLKNLMTHPGNAIMYNDIDISWRKMIPKVLAKNGMYSNPLLEKVFYFRNQHLIEKFFIKDISPEMHKLMKNHFNVFENANTMKGKKRILRMLLSGFSIKRSLQIAKELGWDYIPKLVSGENNIIAVKLDKVKLFETKAYTYHYIVDLHSNPDIYNESNPCRDTHYKENHFLVFLQLLLYRIERDDRSWVIEDY